MIRLQIKILTQHNAYHAMSEHDNGGMLTKNVD